MKTMPKPTTSTTLPGGTFKLADDLILTRMGYGAMQLAGPHVFGPPADHDGALAVLREVVSLGITHISPAPISENPDAGNRGAYEARTPKPPHKWAARDLATLGSTSLCCLTDRD